MIQQSDMGFKSTLKTKLIKFNIDVSPLWKLKNRLHPRFWLNWLGWHGARWFSKVTNILTFTGSLSAVVITRDGKQRVDYGKIAYGLVTTAFVQFMVDQLQTETSVWGDFKFHDSGVGTTAAAVGDTDIETTDAESRVTGSQTEGATADIYKSVGTISYTTTKAITEHGLFSIVTGGTLMDRHVFSAINVVSGDSIEFTYELTVNDGG